MANTIESDKNASAQAQLSRSTCDVLTVELLVFICFFPTVFNFELIT